MAVSPSALGKVLEVFEENFRDRGELGASLSVWWQGAELLSVAHGWREKEHLHPWTEQTLIPVYSSTKVPSSAALLMALEEQGFSEKTRVREVWPEFPVEDALFSHLLSHQCGLAALDVRASIFDHEGVVAAIEAQVPAWSLGQGHGYHPRTFGALVEEPLRRLTGKNLGEYWQEKIARPLDLDFWIGLPEEQWHRVGKLYPGKATKEEMADGFYAQFNTEGTLTRRAFSSPRGLHGVHEMNDGKAWSVGLPAMGGVGSASALAKFYQAVIGAIPGPFSAKVRHALATPQSSSEDKVLLRPTVFTNGCQRDPVDAAGKKLRQLYGPSLSAFGHPGAGGSHAFGDPETGISFAYTMNQMELNVMPGEKCVRLIQELFAEL